MTVRNRETFTHADIAAIWRVVAAKRGQRGDLVGAAIARRNASVQRTGHAVSEYHQDCPGSGRQDCC